MKFNYKEAFSRNIGWLTEDEQERLKYKKVAIAGLGGVGGTHLLTLCRLGVERFHTAEFDEYELVNFNRQVGATMSTLGQSKLHVMAEMAKDINPNCELTLFKDGVTAENVDAFLSGVDLFIDGIDYFAMEARRLIFARCAALGIPAITAGPIGMGAAYLIYMPGGMTFEDYFGLDPLPEKTQYVRYLLGLSPAMLHQRYLVDNTRVNFSQKKGPSTVIACNLCSGVVGAETLKILLHRGKVYSMPYYHVFDAYRNRYIRGRTIGGARNPFLRLKTWIGCRMLLSKNPKEEGVVMEVPTTPIYRILEMARWAPSGDNTQPWRFRVIDESSLEVRYATSELNVYEYRAGEPIHLSVGMLLETMDVAASHEGLSCTWHYEGEDKEGHRITVQFVKGAKRVPENPLYPFIAHRSVDRHGYRNDPLSASQKQAFAEALGEEFSIEWYEDRISKRQISALNALATDIRLRIPEAYTVHKEVIDWKRAFSEDKIPIYTLPVNPVSRAFMRWAMKRWERVTFLNRYMAGTKGPQLEMDIMPGMRCAAHFFITPKAIISDIPALLAAGASLQRFWLTATFFGLKLQPSMATLIFAHYGAQDALFTEDPAIRSKARLLATQLEQVRQRSDVPLFAGRIGYPHSPAITSRSLRKPLSQLLLQE